MKTSIKILTTICTVIISLSATAQRHHNGGNNQSPLAKQWKNGKYSKVTTSHPMIQDKIEQMGGDQDVFDLRLQYLKVERLGHIICRTCFQSFYLLLLASQRGQKYYWYV